MTDAEVIEATRRGDREAFALLVERHQRMVEAVAYSAIGRHALLDDVVQDTFITAWRTIDRLRDPDCLRAWLSGIARNLAHKARRRGRREAIGWDVDDVGAPQTPFGEVSERERDREIAGALADLPARYREPLVLFYYEQCTVKEVAGALALGEDAVMQRLSRGRRRLGEALATRIEIALEHKASRVALVACVLALLPTRAAVAGGASTAATGELVAATNTTQWWRGVVAVLAARWRIPGALIACAGAALVVAAAVERSDEVSARADARRVDQLEAAEPQHHPATTAPPQLPPDDQTGIVFTNITVAGTDPHESCARGARGLAFWALGKDAYRKAGDDLYFEPSPALLQTAATAAAYASSACGGDPWPELYVACEGTLADIAEGKVTCYPYDPFYI